MRGSAEGPEFVVRGRKGTKTNTICDFEKPPIAEVVCGVAFKPLQQFLAPHVGVLWSHLREKYPDLEEKPPLTPPSLATNKERSDEPVVFPHLGPRNWFVSKDGARLIQVQKDRFLHNWRKTDPEAMYPRYSSLMEEFRANFNQFREFIDKRALGLIEPMEFELTYVNVIPEGEGYQGLANIKALFPDFGRGQDPQRLLLEPVGINWTTFYRLPEQQGKLTISINDGTRKTDGRPIVRLLLSARGLPSDGNLKGMDVWFDSARHSIVSAFVNIVSEDVQIKDWGRK